MRIKLIACEIFYREICSATARSPNRIDLEFLPKGLHDIGCEKMSARIQETFAQVDESQFDAVVLGYGLCNNGLVGLVARSLPVIVPRAHDCITLFLGSKERYLECFNNNPGTYYLTSGWIERGDDESELNQLAIQETFGLKQSYEEMVEKYGEDNAKYLYEQLGDLTRHYDRIAYIGMGVGPDGYFEAQAKERATERNWTFDRIQGDSSLIQRLTDGPWENGEFLTVQPGDRIAPSYKDDIITVEGTGS